ncbi:hypothetical protein ACEQ8H_001451 [Pleosporales sp. CAS-2024a]
MEIYEQSAHRNQYPLIPALTCQPTLNHASTQASYNAISPLQDFDITTTPPLKLRPFKPVYHMTMALESTTLSDLIAMDNTFAERCHIRKELLRTERHQVLACNTRAIPAVLELYHWLTTTYLPSRFPTVYTLTPDRSSLVNAVTRDTMPLSLGACDAERALQLLGENIDDEFLFILPSTDPSDKGKYRLEAFINCSPSGFNTRSKLDMLLADIHKPVPGYAQKLEKSMDRFFAALPLGKIVKRSNWNITTNSNLFCLAGNHMTPAELDDEKKKPFDLHDTTLRCERQTLHRLPNTHALVFAFKTYMYPIRELRDEGSGEILAEAIDGLAKGSVPDITMYKKQVLWGEKVKAYLLRRDMDA